MSARTAGWRPWWRGGPEVELLATGPSGEQWAIDVSAASMEQPADMPAWAPPWPASWADVVRWVAEDLAVRRTQWHTPDHAEAVKAALTLLHDDPLELGLLLGRVRELATADGTLHRLAMSWARPSLAHHAASEGAVVPLTRGALASEWWGYASPEALQAAGWQLLLGEAMPERWPPLSQASLMPWVLGLPAPSADWLEVAARDMSRTLSARQWAEAILEQVHARALCAGCGRAQPCEAMRAIEDDDTGETRWWCALCADADAGVES